MRNMRLAIVLPVPAFGDVGPFEATVVPHPYLHCCGHGCGDRLWQGTTTAGAPIYVCRTCQTVTDSRRVP